MAAVCTLSSADGVYGEEAAISSMSVKCRGEGGLQTCGEHNRTITGNTSVTIHTHPFGEGVVHSGIILCTFQTLRVD